MITHKRLTKPINSVYDQLINTMIRNQGEYTNKGNQTILYAIHKSGLHTYLMDKPVWINITQHENINSVIESTDAFLERLGLNESERKDEMVPLCLFHVCYMLQKLIRTESACETMQFILDYIGLSGEVTHYETDLNRYTYRTNIPIDVLRKKLPATTFGNHSQLRLQPHLVTLRVEPLNVD